MNLRILKKLSKRAAALLESDEVPTIRHYSELYPARKWEGHTDSVGHDRKHRDRCRSVRTDDFGSIYLVVTPHHGKGWVNMSEPSCVLKHTMMAGWETRGIDHCDWEEHSAWEELLQRIDDVFTDYVDVHDQSGEVIDMAPRALRTFQNPATIFSAVPDMLAKCAHQEQEREQRWRRQEAHEQANHSHHHDHRTASSDLAALRRRAWRQAGHSGAGRRHRPAGAEPRRPRESDSARDPAELFRQLRRLSQKERA